MFSEVAEIALAAARLGQFQQLLKTRVILILNFTRPHAITYTNSVAFCNTVEEDCSFILRTLTEKLQPKCSELFPVNDG